MIVKSLFWSDWSRLLLLFLSREDDTLVSRLNMLGEKNYVFRTPEISF